jgi:MinD superfamily P-loop ATPase
MSICSKKDDGWFVSDTRFGPMVHARLGIAEENSGKLVTLVRRESKNLAEIKNLDLILTDGPPGVGCPVIASVGGASAVVIVTEPTVSGKHDMERVLQLTAHFKVPAMICINKFDLNLELTREIEKFADEKNIACLGRIPFDPMFTRAMIRAQTVFEYGNGSDVNQQVKAIWRKIEKILEIRPDTWPAGKVPASRSPLTQESSISGLEMTPMAP